MKEPTNIICPNCDKKKTLDKEYWGQDRRQLPEYRLSCQKCGFIKIASTDDMNRYTYFKGIVENV